MASSTLSCLRRCSRSSLAAAQYTRRVTSSTTAFPTSLLSSTARPVSIACTIRPFSSSTTRKMGYDSIPLLQAIENRRSIYALTKKAPQSDARIREIVEAAVKHTPSTFNSQSSRLVVLLNEEHDKFWDTVIEILKAIVPADSWEHTGKRMDMFRGGYGTILFYEDPEPTKALQSKMPQYADKFPQWSEHTSAMHQYVLWTALVSEGFGCNLQHYNPLPDQKVSEIWKIPLEWSLKAQLVFGGLADGARENLQTKTFQPLENRLFVHGAKQ